MTTTEPEKLVKKSKKLSYILRHGADKLKIKMSRTGFVECSLLSDYFTLSELYQITDSCPKKRFEITDFGNIPHIRCVQGHSLNIAPTITEYFGDCVHGTNLIAYEQIKSQGLSRMNRKHIHFSMSKEKCRFGSTCFIYINVKKAYADGILFLVAKNDVILSEGNNDGFIPPDYFLKVEFI
jgi:RNA:NAD 2'-phosphotransferase (TPT1/KptA family)